MRAAAVPRLRSVPVVNPDATRETRLPVIVPDDVTSIAVPVVRPFAVKRTTPVDVVALFAVTARTSPVVVIVPVDVSLRT